MLQSIIEPIAALLLLILLLPFLVIVAFITALFSRGRVFYCQERIGKNGTPFIMYKFTSMVTEAERDGPRLWVPGDKRQTPWGVFIRKRRIDELPQLVNVIKGDMQFIGNTRPERAYYIQEILKQMPDYYELLKKKPGIISFGIVEYGYASNVNEMVERLKLDFHFMNNTSKLKWIKVLLKALWKIMRGGK